MRAEIKIIFNCQVLLESNFRLIVIGPWVFFNKEPLATLRMDTRWKKVGSHFWQACEVRRKMHK